MFVSDTKVPSKTEAEAQMRTGKRRDGLHLTIWRADLDGPSVRHAQSDNTKLNAPENNVAGTKRDPALIVQDAPAINVTRVWQIQSDIVCQKAACFA